MSHLGVTNVDDTVNFRWGRKIGDRLTDEGNQIYGSFTYKDVEYNLCYCVYVYCKGETDTFICKLIQMYKTLLHEK